jgi:hypothetical protein
MAAIEGSRKTVPLGDEFTTNAIEGSKTHVPNNSDDQIRLLAAERNLQRDELVINGFRMYQPNTLRGNVASHNRKRLSSRLMVLV